MPKHEVTFDNCTLYGTIIPADNKNTALSDENRSKVYLTGGTKVATNEELPCDVVSALDEGYKIANSYSLETVTLYTAGGIITKDIEFLYLEQPDIDYNITLSATNGFYFNLEVNKDIQHSLYDEIGADALVGTDLGDRVRYTIPVPVTNIEGITLYLDVNKDEPLELSLNLSQYFRSAFKYSKSDVEKSLIVNAANYVSELYRFESKGDVCEEYKSFVEENESMLIKADKTIPALSVTDTSVISGVQLMIQTDAGVPAFAFTKVSDGVVSVKYNDATVECSERTLLGVTYYVAEGMDVSDMAATLEIYVGENKIGEYNLQSYISATDNLIADALYGYAKAAENINN